MKAANWSSPAKFVCKVGIDLQGRGEPSLWVERFPRIGTESPRNWEQEMAGGKGKQVAGPLVLLLEGLGHCWVEVTGDQVGQVDPTARRAQGLSHS